MCLTTSPGTRVERATEDIVVYKVLSSSNWALHIAGFQYEPNTRYDQTDIVEDIQPLSPKQLSTLKWKSRFWWLNYKWRNGYNKYTTAIRAINHDCRQFHRGFHSFSSPVVRWGVDYHRHERKLVKFTIPAGSLFVRGRQHNGKHGYVSNSIVSGSLEAIN